MIRLKRVCFVKNPYIPDLARVGVAVGVPPASWTGLVALGACEHMFLVIKWRSRGLSGHRRRLLNHYNLSKINENQ